MKKFAIISSASVLALAGSAFAQVVNDNSVTLETRIVNITGSGPRVIGAVNGNFPGQANAAALRFRVEYRLQGGRGGATGFRSGLSGGVLNLTGVGAGTTAAAAITSRENSSSAFPNPNSDSTALQTRTGVNGPFRGGFSNPGDNTLPSNGVPAGSSITQIVPLTISNVSQGAPGFQDPNGTFPDLTGNEWYGLYTFSFTTPATGTGSTTITAAFLADAQTGNRFAYFIDGQGSPVGSNAASSSAVTISYIPAPAAAGLLGLGGLVATRRRRA